MRNFNKITILILGVFIFINCNDNNSSEQDLIKIDIEAAINNNIDLNLSKITSKINYVALETNDSCLLGSIEAFITKEYILVLSKMNNNGLYLFDHDGNFIRRIGKTGKGPGEYRNIGSVSINENNEEIFINTDNKKHLIKFKYNSSYSKSINLHSSVSFVYNDSTFFTHTPSYYFKENNIDTNQLSIINLNGEIINKFHPVDFTKTKYIDMFIETADFSVVDNDVFYFVPKENIIYKISENLFSPYYNLQLGNYKFPKDYEWNYIGYAKSREMNNVYIERAIISKYLLILLISKKGKRNIVIYDKKNMKTYYSLIDDIDHIPITYLDNVYNNKLVQCIEVVKLLNSDKKNEYSHKLKSLLKTAKETDNPILKIISLTYIK